MEEESKNPIQVAEKLFRVIELLAENGPMGIMELSASLGFHKSTVHRLVASLQYMGYIRQDEESLKYSLSLKFLEIGSRILEQTSMAALATVFGTVIACLMSILSVMKRDNFVSLPFIIKEKVRITLEPAKNMFKVASSVFVEQIFMRIGFLTVSIMVAKLGTDAFAAHQVGMNVMSLSFSFGDGMQVAAVALCGRSLGEKRPDLAQMYGTICQRIGNMISIVLAVLYTTLGTWYFNLFFDEPHLVAMGVEITRVLTFIVLLQIAQVIYMGCLRGAGDVVFTTIASTISITFVRPILSYVFCYACGLGLVGIWMGILGDQTSRLLLTTWRFKSGRWMKIEI